jgi:hypothetical protein
MPQETVDHSVARVVLSAEIARARSSGFEPRHRLAIDIEAVMLGKHLTYRYILVTNLLAKATNFGVHALALQAGANVRGAFDSRSLCHAVVVASDRDPEELAGRLGRSNEPFLNKPARYPLLDVSNAVQKGNGRDTLHRCINILSSLSTSADAREALAVAAYYTLQRYAEVFRPSSNAGPATTHNSLCRFGECLVDESNEGESCALLAGICFVLLGRSTNQDFDVRVHPTNQAGSSSNEVLDVDVYADGRLRWAVEVKDKPFTIHDVQHAARKAQAAGLDAFLFVRGPQSTCDLDDAELIASVAGQGVRAGFVDVLQFYLMVLSLSAGTLDAGEFWSIVSSITDSARSKDQTRSHVARIARDCGILEQE